MSKLSKRTKQRLLMGLYLAVTIALGSLARADEVITKAEAVKTLLNNPKATILMCKDQEVTSKATLRAKGDVTVYILKK